jgi:hypothetical protein
MEIFNVCGIVSDTCLFRLRSTTNKTFFVIYRDEVVWVGKYSCELYGPGIISRGG